MLTRTALMLLTLSAITAGDVGFKTPALDKQIQSMVKLQQIKHRILKALNMTTAPQHKKIPTPRILEPTNPVKDSQTSVLLILAESSDFHRVDTMSFKLISQIRENAKNIESVTLVVQLRAKREILPAEEGVDGNDNSDSADYSKNMTHTDLLSGRRHRKNKIKIQGRLYGSSNIVTSWKNGTGVDNETTFPKRKDNQSQSGKTRNHKKRGKLREWKVKVVVKLLDDSTGKTRRIDTERVKLKKNTFVMFPIPKEMLIAAAFSPNHTLTLQLACKRCKGNVQLETVYKPMKKKNKSRKPALNPNRPELRIRFTENAASLDPIAVTAFEKYNQTSRSKRSLSANCPPNFNPLEKLHSSMKFIHSTCCAEQTYITFKELQMDNFIIYPPGISVVYCLGSCARKDSKDEKTSWRSVTHNSTVLQSVSDGHFRPAVVSARSSLNEDESNLDTTESSLERVVSRHCVPSQKSNIDILYIDENNNVILKTLSNVRDTACSCATSP